MKLANANGTVIHALIMMDQRAAVEEILKPGRAYHVMKPDTKLLRDPFILRPAIVKVMSSLLLYFLETFS